MIAGCTEPFLRQLHRRWDGAPRKLLNDPFYTLGRDAGDDHSVAGDGAGFVFIDLDIKET